MPHLAGPLLALAALAVLALAVAAHYAFWGWYYRLRADSDAVLTATCSDGWRLAIARYKPAHPSGRVPVVLCHGLAANRLNMCLPGTHSLAGYLRDKGHEVFAVDLRGCGESHRPPPGKHRNDWSFDDHVLRDAPAVLELVAQTTGSPRALWVGHSMGGLIGLAAAELEETARRLAGVAALGSPTRWNFHRRLLGTVLRFSVRLAWSGRIHNKWVARLFAPWLGYFPVPLNDVSLNPQNIDVGLYHRVAYHVLADASRKVLRQFSGWFARNAWDLDDPPVDLRAGLAKIQCPVLLMAGAMDVLAPPQSVEAALGDVGAKDKSLVIFGQGRGDKQDYGHGDLIFGRHAPAEVFPELERWLRARGEQAAAA